VGCTTEGRHRDDERETRKAVGGTTVKGTVKKKRAERRRKQ
jgi:hypothetical protein